LKTQSAWLTSLHGGHSSVYCDHARDPLDAIVQAAIDRGFHTYGITEHAPRFTKADLYAEEIEMGWSVETLSEKFEDYARELHTLSSAYEQHIHLLKGFEAEVIPTVTYKEKMLHLKATLNFDYLVGSVHYVHGISIDYTEELFLKALKTSGNLEALGIDYYKTLLHMVDSLNPEVVGHFDLVRKLAEKNNDLERASVLRQAEEALELIREKGCIIDINCSPLRRGFNYPYPAPPLLALIKEKKIPVCFGDDSHSASEVGAGLTEAHRYLLDHQIREICSLRKVKGEIEKHFIPLE
jgi:histidinol-phosphatase (PHP family)